MKKLYAMAVVLSAFVMGTASAENIKVYYSPSCPHCHHALGFMSNELVYEYQKIDITAVNVMESENRPEFAAVLKKCKYEVGGVPVIVVGEKCFQGYGPKTADEIRDALSSNMSDSEKSKAAANRKALEQNPEKFKSDNKNRSDIIKGYQDPNAQKKTDENGGSFLIYGLVAAIIIGVGIIIIKKRKK